MGFETRKKKKMRFFKLYLKAVPMGFETIYTEDDTNISI